MRIEDNQDLVPTVLFRELPPGAAFKYKNSPKGTVCMKTSVTMSTNAVNLATGGCYHELPTVHVVPLVAKVVIG